MGECHMNDQRHRIKTKYTHAHTHTHICFRHSVIFSILDRASKCSLVEFLFIDRAHSFYGTRVLVTSLGFLLSSSQTKRRTFYFLPHNSCADSPNRSLASLRTLLDAVGPPPST